MVKRYLYRLYDTIISRGYLEIERIEFDELPGKQGALEGRLRFYDGSVLAFDEVILLRHDQLVKIRYAYHYQNDKGEVIFRYDNAPHYPNIFTFPHHKHIGSVVEPTRVPDLSDVLHEVEQYLFKSD